MIYLNPADRPADVPGPGDSLSSHTTETNSSLGQSAPPSPGQFVQPAVSTGSEQVQTADLMDSTCLWKKEHGHKARLGGISLRSHVRNREFSS